MFEAIEKILDLKKFKEEIFKGKIFVFQKSQFTLDLIQKIKTEISSEYDGKLEKIHYLDHNELQCFLYSQIQYFFESDESSC